MPQGALLCVVAEQRGIVTMADIFSRIIRCAPFSPSINIYTELRFGLWSTRASVHTRKKRGNILRLIVL